MTQDLDSKEITREHVVVLPEGSPHPRVCIFAAYNDFYAPLAEIARPNWAAYARRHHYAVRFYPHGFHLDASRPRTYGDKGRFDWYYDLKGHYDYVVYLDIDGLFTNFEIPLLSLRRAPYARFFYTYDKGGPQSGLWLAGTDDETESDLRFAYEYAARENNVRNGVIEPNGISDQDAFTRLMRVPPFERTFSNCFPARPVYVHADDWQHGNFIVHFGGLSFAEKLARMKEFAARV